MRGKNTQVRSHHVWCQSHQDIDPNDVMFTIIITLCGQKSHSLSRLTPRVTEVEACVIKNKSI